MLIVLFGVCFATTVYAISDITLDNIRSMIESEDEGEQMGGLIFPGERDFPDGISVDGTTVIDGDGSISVTSFSGTTLTMAADGIIYFGGGTGYGIRDNSGTMQWKNEDGSWTDLNTVAGGTGIGWTSITNNEMVYTVNNGSGVGYKVCIGCTATSTDTQLEVTGTSTFDGITTAGYVDLDAGFLIFNESSGDYNARFESDGETHMLFMDSGNDRIGIATGSPTVTFEIDGDFRVAEEGAAQALLVNGGTLAVSMGGALAVTGATTLTGAATLSSTLAVTGLANLNAGIAVDTNVFTVANATGNTVIAGTLNVTGASTVTTLTTGATTMNGSLVVNENSGSNDFRVEGLQNEYLIFADASTNFVGFGTTTPGHFVDIADDLNVGTSTDDSILLVDVGSGVVGISTTTPSGTYVLDIDGDVRIGEIGNAYAFLLNAGSGFASIGTSTLDIALTVEGDLAIKEAGATGDALTVNGGTMAVAMGGALTVTGNTAVTGTLTITGASDVGTFTQGGGVRSTSTLNSTETLLATDFDVENVIEYTMNVSATTLTLPATSTLSALVPTAGDTRTIHIKNATTTAISLTIAGGTGMDIYNSTSTLAIPSGDFAEVTFQRQSDTDIDVFFDIFQ